MKYSIEGLRKTLGQIQALANLGDEFSFSAEERLSLLGDSERLMRQLDSVAESILTVGLLGGTGVGKSSIMNALARADISSISHRRPHTDRIVIYHHSSVELPRSLGSTTVPRRDIAHDVEEIRQIILCDLPDFDSLLGEHCERTLAFLEHLDMLVWVTSPEKYADASFYEFLRQVPKSRNNFYFVFNKADLLFDGSLERGYDQLERGTGQFQKHLAENGMPHPLIYVLSAAEVLKKPTLASWNQFSSFRHQIFQHRGAKEVMAIKGANLDVETERLVSVFEKEFSNFESLRHIVGEFINKIETERAEWAKAGNEAFDHWLKLHLNKQVFQQYADLSPLVGPGYGIAAMAQEWRKRSRGGDEKAIVKVSEDEGAGALLELQLERVQNRAAQEILLGGFPASFVSRLNGLLDTRKEWEGFSKRLQGYVEVRVRSHQSGPSRWFKAVQYLTYSFLFIFLLIALGGETAWVDLFQNPSWYHLGMLFAAMIHHVYSPVGVAALGSYVLLLMIFGFRFFNSYRKSLRRRTQKFIETLKLELEEIWLEQFESLLNRLREFERRLEERMSAIAALNETRKKE